MKERKQRERDERKGRGGVMNEKAEEMKGERVMRGNQKECQKEERKWERVSDGKRGRGRVTATMMRERKNWERREGKVLTGRKRVYLSAPVPQSWSVRSRLFISPLLPVNRRTQTHAHTPTIEAEAQVAYLTLYVYLYDGWKGDQSKVHFLCRMYSVFMTLNFSPHLVWPFHSSRLSKQLSQPGRGDTVAVKIHKHGIGKQRGNEERGRKTE